MGEFDEGGIVKGPWGARGTNADPRSANETLAESDAATLRALHSKLRTIEEQRHAVLAENVALDALANEAMHAALRERDTGATSLDAERKARALGQAETHLAEQKTALQTLYESALSEINELPPETLTRKIALALQTLYAHESTIEELFIDEDMVLEDIQVLASKSGTESSGPIQEESSVEMATLRSELAKYGIPPIEILP